MNTGKILLKNMTARILLACMLLVLPLGPFSWSQSMAATPAPVLAESEQVEIGWCTRVAMGQTLKASVLITAPDTSTENSGSASFSDYTYLAKLKYMSFDPTNDGYISLCEYVNVRPGVETIIETKVTPEWATGSYTRQKLIVISNNPDFSTIESVNSLYIEPASRIVSFNLNVPEDDPNQPSEKPKSIQAAYGQPYSYNPVVGSGGVQTLPTPTRPNYEFDGWYTDYNASTGAYSGKATDESLFMGTSDTVLYAKWTGKKCIVNLSGYDYEGINRGNLNTWCVTVNYGETYKVLAGVTGTGITGDNVELRGFTTEKGIEVKPGDVVDSSFYDWKTGPLTLFSVWGTARESIEGAEVEGLADAYSYTGNAIEPEISVVIPEIKGADGSVEPKKILQKGKDYVVTCENNTELSTDNKQASVLIEGTGAYKGSISKTFRITTGTPFFEFNGVVFEAGDEAIVVPFSGSGATQVNVKLVTDAASGVAYSLAFADPAAAGSEVLDDYASIDPATGVITVKKPLGSLVLRVSATAPAGTKFAATPATGVSCLLSVSSTALSECTVSLDTAKYTYSGKAKTPSVTVKSPAGTKLVKGTDYTVKYASGRKAVGTYKVTVTGMGGYTGSVTKSFTIVPKGCSKLKAAKTSQTTKYKGKTYRVYALSWSKVSGIDGYQVKRTIDKSATTNFKPSVTSVRYAWPKGKTVKVQVRTYKKASGKKLYSDWKAISVKAK